jgi:hypothetical protein
VHREGIVLFERLPKPNLENMLLWIGHRLARKVRLSTPKTQVPEEGHELPVVAVPEAWWRSISFRVSVTPTITGPSNRLIDQVI